MRLSLIGTVHEENGQASVTELLLLLDRLRPDVIFAEIPDTHLERYRDGSHGGLESSAVARYLQGHPIPVIAVDLEKPDEDFFREAREMFGKVERTSHDYRLLVDQHSRSTAEEGFPYLNSDRCGQAWGKIHAEVLATLAWMRQPGLAEIYDRWRRQHQLREAAMLQAIADHSGRDETSQGVLLVGAAHRMPLCELAHTMFGSALIIGD